LFFELLDGLGGLFGLGGADHDGGVECVDDLVYVFHLRLDLSVLSVVYMTTASVIYREMRHKRTILTSLVNLFGKSSLRFGNVSFISDAFPYLQEVEIVPAVFVNSEVQGSGAR